VGSGLDARKVREGRDLCILAVGKLVAAAREAAEALAADGIEATVWDVRVVPLDPEMIADAARHPVVLTAEDGLREGGVGALIADAVARLDLASTPPRVRVLGTPTAYLPQAKPDAILAELGLDAKGLETEARALVAALKA
jgi:1-deoxy-D-xylulose-5-phosphate synthase